MKRALEQLQRGAKKLLNRVGENTYIGWLLWLFPYRSLQVSKDRWERQYRGGDWSYLNDVKELGRYSIITGYCNHIQPEGNILDVACGEGILLEYLGEGRAESYTGIDFSEAAIRAAREKQDSRAVFIAADTLSFESEKRFGIIIFNECLYYYRNPVQVMKKYARMLEPGGVMVVSLYVSPSTRRIWKMLKREFLAEDEIRLSNSSGNAWTVKVFLG